MEGANYIRRVQLYYANMYTSISFEKNTWREKLGDASGKFIYSIIEDAIARHCNANFQLAGVEAAERNITEM